MTSKLRVTGLCARNSPVTGEFPAQRASNAENISIWWRHHDKSSNMWLQDSIQAFKRGGHHHSPIMAHGRFHNEAVTAHSPAHACHWWRSGPRLNIKTDFPDMGILMLKIRRSWDRIIFNMGIPILVRQHLYIETPPGDYNIRTACWCFGHHARPPPISTSICDLESLSDRLPDPYPSTMEFQQVPAGVPRPGVPVAFKADQMECSPTWRYSTGPC